MDPQRPKKQFYTLLEVVDELCKYSDEEQNEESSDEEQDLLFSEVNASDTSLDQCSDDSLDEDWQPELCQPSTSAASFTATASSSFGDKDEARSKDRGRVRGRGRSQGRGRGRERSSDRGRGRGRGRSRGRGAGKGQVRGRQERGSCSSGSTGVLSTGDRWHTPDEPDISPPDTIFRPARTPGPQIIQTESYSPLELFRLFFSSQVCQTIIRNSNTYAAEHLMTARRPRQGMSMKDLFSFISIVIYMGLVKLPSVADYWSGSRLYSLGFPASVMSCRKFHTISSALHLSDPKVDAENANKKGTPAFDRLCKVKPLYDQIRDGCKSFYHPHQNIAVDERMVASKARICLKQYQKEKPTKWGYKLFVLADSLNAYTWDFFIYEGKSPVDQSQQGKGLSYESVMALVDEKFLGSGYKLYVDNFYTSPMLFRDLCKKNIWACGTIRSNRVGFPKTTINRLPKNAPRGSMRWKRDDQLLFIEWKDTREVLMCSSFHSANEGQTVQRRVKMGGGEWTTMTIPIPSVVSDYNKNMGGVDMSDALIGYYSVLRKTRKWYRSLFFHFVDIAVVNAFIIHQHLAAMQSKKPKNQREFREALIQELADWLPPPDVPAAPAPASQHSAGHTPKHLKHSSKFRRRCRVCHQKTPVICCMCDMPLCFLPNRDCFNRWHNDHL